MEDDKNNEHIKVLNFLAITETKDQYIAKKYIQQAKGDISLAVSNYMGRRNSYVSSNSNDSGYLINEPPTNINNSFFSSNTNSNLNDSEYNSVFYQNVINPLKNILGCCFPGSNYSNNGRQETEDEEDSICYNFNNKITNLDTFNEAIKIKIGIIIFYSNRNVAIIRRLMNKILDDNQLFSVVIQNYVFYPVLVTSNEGKEIQKLFRGAPLIYPSFSFCFNKTSKKNYKSTVFLTLESDTFSFLHFKRAIYDSINILNNNFKNNRINFKNNTKTNIKTISSEIIEDDIIEEPLSEGEFNIDKDDRKKNFEEINLDEPKENDPNSISICFRYPNGEKKQFKRFLKTDKIKNLYDFVESLGKEIYTENCYNSFSLDQTFPPKKYDNMENSLEDEGLFPSAIIQIKEKKDPMF